MIKFSILLPCYNGEKYLEQAINSVLNQDYKNWELIIIDGKSTDNSHEIINKYCELDTRIKWLKYKDKGISDALNYGLINATGNFIGWIGSDDKYHDKNVFSSVSEKISSNKNIKLIYGDITIIDEKEEIISKVKMRKISMNEIFNDNVIGGPNVFFSKKLFDKVGFFNIRSKYAMDYEYWIRCLKSFNKFDEELYYFDRDISFFRIHAESISVKLFFKQKTEALIISFKEIYHFKNIPYFLKFLKSYLVTSFFSVVKKYRSIFL